MRDSENQESATTGGFFVCMVDVWICLELWGPPAIQLEGIAGVRPLRPNTSTTSTSAVFTFPTHLHLYLVEVQACSMLKQFSAELYLASTPWA